MTTITNNYENGLMREIEQYTELITLAKEKDFEENIITNLEYELNIVKVLLEKHTEVKHDIRKNQ